MEPNKTPKNPNDLVIFQNTDTEDFEWYHDTIKTPLPYYIKAGETRELPYYIAVLGIEHLIDRILDKAGKLKTSPLLRSLEREKIFLGIKHINYIREKTANEQALEDMQRKKETDPYDELITKRQIEAERIEAERLAAMAPKAPLIETIGTPVQARPASSPLNNIDAPANVAEPDRVALYQMLTNDLHMDLTHVQTKQKLDATPLEQLKGEFASQLPQLQTAFTPDKPQGIQAPVVNSTPYIPNPALNPANAVMDAAIPAAPAA